MSTITDMAIIKKQRDIELIYTDWTQIPDCQLSEEKKAEFRVYRQALRDIPQNFANAEDVVFPVKPVV